MNKSLLAHLAGRLAPAPETIATESLRYILNASPGVCQALVDRVASRAGFEPFKVESIESETEVETGGRPDITIYDAASLPRIHVENKFWAGLTASQPVEYLNSFPEEPESALLFVVPEARIVSIWQELKERCVKQELKVGTETTKDEMKRVPIGSGRNMLISSWGSILDTLQRTASEIGDTSEMQDIVQLRGLSDRMDVEALPPLREDETTDVNVPRRMINYADLSEGIAQVLKNKGIASFKGVKPTNRYEKKGRYFSVGKGFKFGVWLGVDIFAWRDWGITPIWLEVHKTEWGGLVGHWSSVKRMRQDHREYANHLCFPIRLACTVDKDRVIEDAVIQMREIIDLFERATLENPPPVG